jgi:hypothetical protein
MVCGANQNVIDFLLMAAAFGFIGWIVAGAARALGCMALAIIASLVPLSRKAEAKIPALSAYSEWHKRLLRWGTTGRIWLSRIEIVCFNREL